MYERLAIAHGSVDPNGVGWTMWMDLTNPAAPYQWRFFSTLGQIVSMLDDSMELVIDRFTSDGWMRFSICIDPNAETRLDKLNAEFAEQFR
jgi:hypothetical protein